MTDLSRRVQQLSGPKQRLLRRLLGDRGIDLSRIILPGESGPAPLSHSQEQLWFLEQLGNVAPAYNEPFALRLRGPLEVAALERSVDELVRRHDVLRTVFTTRGGEPLQVVRPHQPVTLALLDLRDGAGDEGPDGWQRRATEITRRPFDLAAGPLLRLALFRLGDREHVLLLVVHHILADLWSMMGVAARELVALYEAFSRGEPPRLPSLPIQFSDYARWERQRWSPERSEVELAWWKEHLDGVDPVLELPGDRPRPSTQSFSGRRVPVRIDRARAAGALEIGRQEGATPFMTLLAAYQILLFRYAGQQRFCVGAPIVNRTQREAEGLIGYFINILPLRADLSGDPSFREVVRRVRATALAAYAHQETPFERIVGALAPERGASHNPLVQVGFSLQNVPSTRVELRGLSVEPVDVDRGTSKFDLLLQLDEGTDGLGGFAEYSSDLFEPASIDRMLEHLEVLLAEAGRRPDAAVSSLELLGAAERRVLLVEHNDTEMQVPAETAPGLIAATAARHPERVAVVCGERQRSYGELAEAAGKLAARLGASGAGPGALVGVCVARSVEVVEALLGVLWSGAAYVPLDPSYPGERLAMMIEDAGIGLVVTDAASEEVLPDDVERVLVDRMDESADPVERPAPGPEDVAYVIYTSGSTGRPKGVQIEHRNLVNFLWSMRERPGLGDEDVLCAVTSISFDIAALELFLPLVVGARVHIAGAAEVADGGRLLALLQASGATVMQATPATWQLLLDSGWTRPLPLRALCGGEELSPELAGRLGQLTGELWNLYGPTETTIWSTVHRVEGAPHRVSIGRPIGNTRVYVLDGAGNPVPAGVPGELFIGGAGLARGYLGRPELSAERFVTREIAGRSERLYRTGDIARWGGGGQLEFLGRSDRQIKLRGFRIEPGEIEAALERHPAVGRAVVLVNRSAAGDRRLVAYYTSSGAAAPVHELRALVQGLLPPYMVPSLYVPLQAFPLTPNGKVDRRALPRPSAAAGADRAVTGPRDDDERLVAEIWQQVLDVERIGIDDNFFDLGGHSLLLARAHGALEERLGRRFPLVEMLRNPTIAALAAYLRDGEPEVGLSERAADSLRAGRRRLAQQRRARREGNTAER